MIQIIHIKIMLDIKSKEKKQLFLLDSEESQEVELFLTHTNTYKSITVTSKEITSKKGIITQSCNKIPILVTHSPKLNSSKLSCKRYFISRIIEKIKYCLIKRHLFHFDITKVEKLELEILKELDCFDSSQATFSLNANLHLCYVKDNKKYNAVFKCNNISMLGNSVNLVSSNTLAPEYFNIIKYLINIPNNTMFYYKNNLIEFSIQDKNYVFNTDTLELI